MLRMKLPSAHTLSKEALLDLLLQEGFRSEGKNPKRVPENRIN